jgi:hypothetical protein
MVWQTLHRILGLEMNINELHIPKDVDKEIKNDFIEILQKIPENWGRWITCDRGWYKLIIDTHKKLKYIDPNYEIHQIKEKFGGLRYYYQSSFPFSSMQDQIMEAIVNAAEEIASKTCETCGIYDYKAKVETRVRNHWYKTLCMTCSIKQGYSIKDEDV